MKGKQTQYNIRFMTYAFGTEVLSLTALLGGLFRMII